MNPVTKTILCVTFCLILSVVTGCEEQGITSERQERLYAVENMELKKQIAEREKQCQKDIKAKQEELDKCNEGKSALQQQLQENTVKVFTESITPSLMQQIQELTGENTQLKARIEELEKQTGAGQTTPQP